MDLKRLFEKKSKGQYDTEYFKNKVKISELEEKQIIQKQRDKIVRMQNGLNKKRGGSGNNMESFMQGMGSFAQNSGYNVGKRPSGKRRKGEFGGGYGGSSDGIQFI
jgi:hypothetical protein